MGIQNFPAALQPIIQQGFLEREFEQALHLAARLPRLRGPRGDRGRHRRDADQDPRRPEAVRDHAGGAGHQHQSRQRPDAAGNWGVEQYTITINHYAATTDLNMVTSRVGIARQFLQNAYVNGEQAARSLDELARNALFNAYFGGNTRVRTHARGGRPRASPSMTCAAFRPASSTACRRRSAAARRSPSPWAQRLHAGRRRRGQPRTCPPRRRGGISGVLTFSTNVAVVGRHGGQRGAGGQRLRHRPAVAARQHQRC